ncbi:MAG: helix-turn-helix domain-containing protein [Aquincola sp.]|uniref:helix-turn-helix domain-containing protein n=1 Tax=uncultured Aquincola sp. TaxID=886556 RepID=UPI0032B15F72|nr:helix-turn-helix domain-containing protein [Aquincola sp.]
MKQTTEQFEDVHLHAASVPAWDQTYHQITPGLVRSSLQRIEGRRFQFFREHINQRLVQQGQAPRDRVCFALPLAVPGPTRMQGREADEHCVFVLKGGEDFMFHMPPGMDLLSITLDRESFARSLDASPWGRELQAWLRQPVIRVPRERLMRSRERLLALLGRFLPMADGDDEAPLECEMEQHLFEELTCLLADPAVDRRQKLPSSPGSFIVEKCHQMAVAEPRTPPSVLDLCQRLRISRRTVQSSFRAVTGTTPVNYIRSIRLNGVRRELLGSRADELTVGDAAGRWGFYHLSHFAADYQALFGELPSRTARAGRRQHALSS